MITLSLTEYDLNMREAYEAGYEKAKKEYERPQGEWVDCGEYYKCPFCENWVLTVDGKPKFCGECGAKMR